MTTYARPEGKNGQVGCTRIRCISGAGRAGRGAELSQPTVRIVVPATPGGGSDIFARLVAQHLSGVFKQQVVVDNKPGAGTLVGRDEDISAPHDGHTLYLSPSTSTSMHVVRKTMPYEITRVF